jgi:hypothetical protein
MHRRAPSFLLLLLGLGAAPWGHAAAVATYGVGLKSCQAYVDSDSQESADEVAFVDWLGGYLSGVNATSNHRNNILGRLDVKGAMYWLRDYCRAHTDTSFAAAAGSFLLGANSMAGAHSVELTAYGSGYKACHSYLEARVPGSSDGMEFIDWLGGYLSGVNAISIDTNNILGGTRLPEAVRWLDAYCTAHAPDRFSSAVQALVAGQALLARSRAAK